MTEQPITLRVQNSSTFIEGTLRAPIYKEFKKALGYKDPQAIWKAGATNFHWDGYVTTVCYARQHCKCAVKKDGMHFPTGLLSRAIEFFKAYGVPLNYLEERADIERDRNYTMSEHYEPRSYQEQIAETSIPTNSKKGGRGIIKMATGGGKTATASAIIARAGVAPAVFYVTSIDLLKQAKEELERFIRIDGEPVKVGAVGAGKCDIRDITVMTVQTAVRALGEKYEKYDDEDESETVDTTKTEEIQKLIMSAKLIMCDEVQHWAAKTCQVIADNSVNAKYRFGLSATPWRDMGDDLLIDACFGKPIIDINASYLIKEGVLVKPSIYFIKTKADIKGTYQTVYQQGIVQNPERNALIANIAQQMVKNGRQVLILVKHIEHGDLLEGMIEGSFFVHGAHTPKQRSEWIDKMRSRNAPVTIATSIFDEGVDVKPLDGLILAGSGKSQTRALQRIGRVIRSFSDPVTGFVKKDAFIVDFYDDMKYMRDHSRKRKQIYQTEPEFIIKMYEK